MKKIKDLINRIKSSDFVKNILTLISGNVIGYAINLVSLPIISRVYTQGELGGYDLVVSTSSIFVSIFGLALLLVIMIPKEDDEANRICKIILSFTMIGTTVVEVICLIGSPFFHLFDVDDHYEIVLLLFGGYIIFKITQEIFYSCVNRKKLYRVLFWNPVLTAAVNGMVSIVMGLLGLGTAGYLFGTISSYIVAIIHMRRYVHPFEGHDRLSDLWATLKNYKSYPLVQLPANFISDLGLQIPTQFLGRIFGTTVLGGYTMANRIMSVPVSLLATPINKVYYRTLVEKKNKNEDVGEFAFSLIKSGIRIAIIPFGILMIFGDWILGFVLGEEWSISGVYITIMGMMFLMKYCSSCMSGTFVAMGRQKISIEFSVFSLILYIVCFGLILIMDMDVMYAIIFYTVFAFIREVVNLSLCMHCLNFSVRKFLIFILTYVGGGMLIIYTLYALRLLITYYLM